MINVAVSQVASALAESSGEPSAFDGIRPVVPTLNSLRMVSAASRQTMMELLLADVARAGGHEERGGILLGTRRGAHFHVLDATLPMAGDRGSRFSFRRGRAGHSEFARKRWLQSRHVVDWLGEWHSHPQSIPLPSGIDLASWRQIADRRGAPMLFLILGYHGTWMGMMQPGQARPKVFTERERSFAGIGFARVR